MYTITLPNNCNVIHYNDRQGALYELMTLISYSTGAYTYNPQHYPLNCPGASTNGIETIYSNNTVTVYPNPFDQNIIVEVDIQNDATINTAMYNLLGQEVLAEMWLGISGHFKKSINTINLSPGVYLIRITINGAPFIYKLIKQ